MKKTAKESAASKPTMSQGETLGRGRLARLFFLCWEVSKASLNSVRLVLVRFRSYQSFVSQNSRRPWRFLSFF